MQENKHLQTLCVHEGDVRDEQFGGAVSPVFMATSYPFIDVETKRYPRYFNTPNQEQLGKKIAALEHTEKALLFGSGIAAISTSLLAFLKSGDHVVFQNQIYGGAHNFIVKEFENYGILYDFTEGLDVSDFKKKIKPNTKIIYIETPSNPLLSITDIRAVAQLAKTHGLISMIDNTFASPVNQTPVDFGIDICIHSATKYLGGHSDILAGAVAGKKEHIDKIFEKGINLGGNLSDFTAYLLERSMKTLAIRVEKHNTNALLLAEWLQSHPAVDRVYYPGLPAHPGHEIARRQMKGFGGMLSFELKPEYDPVRFLKGLRMIKPTMSLAGVESTVLLPALTSHALLTPEERLRAGIKDGLLRLSVGIEHPDDIKSDLEQAFGLSS